MESHSRSERCHTFKMRLGPIRLNFNPVVTVLSGVIIWGFVIWCVVDTARASENMSETKTWLTKTCTWFYIASINVLILFLLYLYFSKYSDLKLGKDDEKPEFSDASYFTMLFAAGIGIGLFYFSVALWTEFKRNSIRQSLLGKVRSNLTLSSNDHFSQFLAESGFCSSASELWPSIILGGRKKNRWRGY